jgi:beta-lactamase class A
MYDYHRYQYPGLKKRSKTNRLKFIVILSVVFVVIGVVFINSALKLLKSTKTYEFSSQPNNFEVTVSSSPLSTPTPTPSFSPTNISLLDAINEVVGGKQGTYGWYVHNLKTNLVYGANYDFSFTAASVNKVPIMIAYLKEVEAGHQNLSSTYYLDGQDIEEGSGSLQYQDVGTPYTFTKLLEFAGKNSDNTAANVIARIIGKGPIQAFINSRLMDNTNIVKNTTSPKEMGELFADVYADKIFKNQKTKEFFYQTLSQTDYEDRISAGVPEGTLVVHKIGNQIQVWNDCGLVIAKNPYVLCILTDGTAEEEAKEVLPSISRLVWKKENKS